MLAERLKRIELSTTLKISAKAKGMRAEGIDVVDLSVGEPDFPTPDNVKQAAQKAIEDNFTKYTQNDGLPELKKAIIKKLKDDNGVSYKPGEIIVSSGAKHSLYNLSVAILNKDEEVIIPAPFWVSYPQQVLLAKGKPVVVPTREEDGFRLTPKQLKDHINFNTKAVIINNPCNPTGTGYPAELLEELANIAVAEGILIIADEIYEKIVYDGFKFVSIASLSEAIKQNTVVINGVSKAYSMTGWRIGYAAGPESIISAMNTIQSHNTSNPNSIAQMASIEAMIGPQSSIQYMVAEFQKRRNFVLQKLKQIKGISCFEPQGAFYLFPNIASTFNKEYQGMTIRNSFGLAYYLLKEGHVAVVPGDAFGADNYIRLSYATSMENLEKACDRLIEAIDKLHVARGIRKRALHNTVTQVKGRIDVQKDIESSDRDALVNEAEYYLPYDQYYEWNANINGIIIQLRTNIAHLHDFWVENWYPAQIESDLEPHGIIYAVEGVPGREPCCFYHSDSKTGIIFNTSYYGQAKQLAIGIVADLGERLFNLHVVRAGCLDYKGKGLLFIASGKTDSSNLMYGLLSQDGVRIHSDDVVFIRYRERTAVADISERKYYPRTRIAKHFPDLNALFERSKCENVVTSAKDCTNTKCHLEECMLDRGEPYCFFAYDKSRCMLDPAWLKGPDGYAKRTSVKAILVLDNDAFGTGIQQLDQNEALLLLEGARDSMTMPDEKAVANQFPFKNPYLLNTSGSRLEMQKMFYQQLLSIATCYRLNTTTANYYEQLSWLKDLLKNI
ncbi:pyridoxal phosphate-dependent aminotransferase [bacterium]|nr:pyridoxal phosphate-dependent aminotransferase [bacterium]